MNGLKARKPAVIYIPIGTGCIRAGKLAASITMTYAMLESCTNQVESYFSRLRRMIRGQHHHVSARHLHQYTNHTAWLEDNRRLSNGELTNRLGGLQWRIRLAGTGKGIGRVGSEITKIYFDVNYG